MKYLKTVLALTVACLSTSAFAAGTCEAQAAEKKLAGAAKSSFVKKCDKDAMAANPAAAACEKTSAEKKLAGAAKSSYMKKCVADAGGAASAPKK
jgi:long-subunit fatty acid transport protein